MFCVSALLYGDYPELAERLLGSLTDLPPHVREVRLGLNAVSVRTQRRVDTYAQHLSTCGIRCVTYTPREPGGHGFNAHKYPLMRRMLYGNNGQDWTLTDRYVMWFDDDSYVRSPKLWPTVAAALALASNVPTVLGSIYSLRYNYTPEERQAIQRQLWFGYRALLPMPPFCTGGWWVAPWNFLRAWNYPFPEIDHNGGDVLLGELIRQQGGRLVWCKEHVAINADASGRESKAKRRGDASLRPWHVAQDASKINHTFHCEIRECSRSTPSGLTSPSTSSAANSPS